MKLFLSLAIGLCAIAVAPFLYNEYIVATALDAGFEFSIRVLEHGIHAERDPLPQMLFEEADTLADQLTPILMRSTRGVELGDDWISTAINHSAGWHWRYWVGRGMKWRSMQTGEHLPELITRNLRMLLEQNWEGASIARILFRREWLYDRAFKRA